MKLTASTSFCYISNRNGSTVQVNMKETILENNGFLQTFICWMDWSQRIKDLLHDKFSISWEKDRFPLLLENLGPMLSNNLLENLRDKLKFSYEIAHYGKSSTSAFDEIFISTDKIFISRERLNAKSTKFWDFPDIS